MWINIGIFLSVYVVVFILLITLKKMKVQCPPEEKPKKSCKFKITTPRFKKIGKKKYAFFSVILVGENTAFFEDFPIAFRFYSDTRFKTKVNISYTTQDTPEPVIILNNKIVVFERNAQEFLCPITDIIPDEIHIELEVEPEYGYPNCTFEIRKNKLCDLTTDLTKEIIFPK